MTKAELGCSRSLMAETNSIIARLDSTKIHDAVIGATLAAPLLRRSRFSPATPLLWNGARLSRKPRRCLRVPHPGRRRTCETWLFRCGSGDRRREPGGRRGQSTQQFAHLIPGRAVAEPRASAWTKKTRRSREKPGQYAEPRWRTRAARRKCIGGHGYGLISFGCARSSPTARRSRPAHLTHHRGRSGPPRRAVPDGALSAAVPV